MTKSYPLATIQNSNKSNWLSGCILTLLTVLFGVLGVFDLIYGHWEWLCRRCHMIADGRMGNLKQFKGVAHE